MQLQGLRLGIEPAPSGSLDQRSTNWATEAVADSFVRHSLYYYPFDDWYGQYFFHAVNIAI